MSGRLNTTHKNTKQLFEMNTYSLSPYACKNTKRLALTEK